jgi:hypothetical protein
VQEAPAKPDVQVWQVQPEEYEVQCATEQAEAQVAPVKPAVQLEQVQPLE